MKYSQDHIWLNEDEISMGISDFAQKALRDIVFIELPEVDQVFDRGEKFGSVESVKSVSALYAPVAMKIVEVNETLEDEPEIINSDPYEAGWIIKVEILNEEEMDELLNEEEYLKTVKE